MGAKESKVSNDKQVGGDHYKAHPLKCPDCNTEIQHWDIAWGMKFDMFQYIISKWLFRWRHKGGLEDLYKIRHAVNKYIQVAEVEAGGPTSGYVNQD